MKRKRFVILSDIHANWTALEAVLDDVESSGGADHVVCAGDNFGYGPRPKEVADALLSMEKHGMLTMVPGNHDDVMSGKHSVTTAPGSAYEAVRKQSQHISDHHAQLHNRFPSVTTFGLGDSPSLTFGLTHGSMDPNYPYDYLDIDSSESVERELEIMDDLKLPGKPQHIIVGHTHVPGLAILGPNQFFHGSHVQTHHVSTPRVITVRERCVINPGSVGQPRDGNKGASYATVERSGDGVSVRFHRVAYDIEKVLQDTMRLGYPIRNAERLFFGR